MLNGIFSKVSSCFLPQKKRNKSNQYKSRRSQEIDALLSKIDLQSLEPVTSPSDKSKANNSTKSTSSNIQMLKKTSCDSDTTTQLNPQSFLDKMKIDQNKLFSDEINFDHIEEILESSEDEDILNKSPNKNITQIYSQTLTTFARKNNFARTKVSGCYSFQDDPMSGLRKEHKTSESPTKEKDKPTPRIKIGNADEKLSPEKQGPENLMLKDVEDILKARNRGQERRNTRKNTTNQTPSEKIEEIRKYQEAKIYDKEKYKREMAHIINRLRSLELHERFHEEEKFIKEQIEDPGTHQEHYLLDIDWAIDYTAYLKQNQVKTSTSPVNNKPLLDPVLQTIKKTLKEGVEYVLINEKTWLFLINMYGGGPEISKSYFIEEQSMNSVHSRSSSLFSDSHLRTLETQKSDQVSTGDSVNASSPIMLASNNTPIIINPENRSSIRIQTAQRNQPITATTINRGISAEKGKKSTIVKPPIINYGLQNTSNYCFLNAGLQCLLCLDEFNDYFDYERYKQINFKTVKDAKYILAYSELLKNLRKNLKTNYTNASAFKKHIKKQFDPYEQHDIQEFLRFILSEIQDELNPYYSKKKSLSFSVTDPEQTWELYMKYHISIVDKLFSGQFLNQVTCKKCNNISKTFDPFLDLSVSICGKNIYDSFNSFFAEENLPDLYKCEFCKKKSQAKKNMTISKTPKLLVVHLKRFKTYPSKRKIGDFVDFPIERLDIKGYCAEKVTSGTTYNLRAFGIHLGSLDGGHYVAFGKRKNDWFYFDDEEVTKITKKEIEKKDAYLLFYERLNE